MKKSIVIIVIIITFSCNTGNIDDSPLPDLSTSAIIVPLDTTNGYDVNPVTGDSIEIIDLHPDTLITGKAIPATGRIIDPATVAKPIVIHAGKPKQNSTNTNIHPAGKPNVVKIPVNLPLCTPGTDSFSLPEIISAGEIKQQRGRYPQQITGIPSRLKDDANCNIQYLDVEQGMASSYIYCILEDKRGAIWFGTNGGGASKYDGRSFTHYSTREGLGGNTVWSMAEDKNGAIWFCTGGGGVSRYDGDRFTNFTTKQGLSDNIVLAMLEDQNGALWFGTNSGGVSKYDGGNFTNYNTKHGLRNNKVWSMFEDKSGALWFGTDGGGVSKFDGKSFTNYTTKEGLINNSVKSILEDKNGALWFGTDGSGVSKYDGNIFTHFTTREGLCNNSVWSILEDKSGAIWLGTYGGGASKYDGMTFNHYTTKEGLSDNIIRAMVEDKSGVIWFATEGGGVSRYEVRNLTHYTTKEGLNNNVVLSIIEDENGAIWFGTNGGGVSKYDNNIFTHYTSREGLSATNKIWSILEDKSGAIWFGTYGRGASKYDGKTFTHYTTMEGLSSNVVRTMLEDKKGAIWFGTYGGGVTKYDGKIFTHYTTKEGLSSNVVRSMAEDKNGTIWFGTSGGGVTKYDGNSFIHYTTKEGLSDNRVMSIAEDKSGAMWFGTYGGGVSKFDGKTFTHFTTKNGLSNDLVLALNIDPKGNIFVSTEDGLNYLMFTPSSKTIIFTFGKEDGLKGLDGAANSMLIDNHNRLWFGTGKALGMMELNKFSIASVAPKVNLNSVDIEQTIIDYRTTTDSIAAGREIYIGEENKLLLNDMHFESVPPFYNYPFGLVLPHYLNHLTFNFVALDLSAPHKILYRYCLEGLGKGWSPVVTENKAEFSNTPPGKYVFKVMAAGISGVWSEPFEYRFVIDPPWWETKLARVGYGIMFIMIVWLAVRLNSRRFMAQKKKLEHEVANKTHHLVLANMKIEETKMIIEVKHKELTDSIDYAKLIQDAMLVSHSYMKKVLNEHFVLFKPRDVVSGDFYWCYETKRKVIWAVCDSTGHGVPGAFLSMLNISLLDEAVIEKGLEEPDDILNFVRTGIVEKIGKQKEGVVRRRDGMDAAMCVLDKQSDILSFSGAYNPLLIVRKGIAVTVSNSNDNIIAINDNTIEFKADKMAIGYDQYKIGLPFTRHLFKVKPDDVLYIYSDGFQTQIGGPLNKKFMTKRFKEILFQTSKLPMEEQLHTLDKTITDWQAGGEQTDDLCVIGVRITQKAKDS